MPTTDACKCHPGGYHRFTVQELEALPTLRERPGIAGLFDERRDEDMPADLLKIEGDGKRVWLAGSLVTHERWSDDAGDGGGWTQTRSYDGSVADAQV
jgi:hypothetical protein